MSYNKPSWHNPLPSQNPPKKPVAKGGWTKPDNTVRCKKCGVGQDESGAMVGTPIAAYTVTCDMGRDKGSVAVAKFARCYKCGTFSGDFRMLDKARELGLTFMGIMGCLKMSRGTWFTLAELKAGKIEQVNNLPVIPQQPIEREEIFNLEGNNKEEEQATLPL